VRRFVTGQLSVQHKILTAGSECWAQCTYEVPLLPLGIQSYPKSEQCMPFSIHLAHRFLLQMTNFLYHHFPKVLCYIHEEIFLYEISSDHAVHLIHKKSNAHSSLSAYLNFCLDCWDSNTWMLSHYEGFYKKR